MKQNFTFLLLLLCSVFATAQNIAVQVPASNVRLLKTFQLTTPSAPGPILNSVTANSLYSDVTNFTGQGFANGGATLASGTTSTYMVADDITMVTNSTYIINQFRFSVANFNSAAVAARAKVRLYISSGTGAPSTLLAAYDFNPIAFPASAINVFSFSLPTPLNLTQKQIWAGISFDDNGGSTGATLAQLNLLGQGIFAPVDQGSSQDLFFETSDAGTFTTNNPAGSYYSFNGNPTADYGWEFVSSTPLPVTLTNFIGTKNGKTNLLTWVTEQETNSSQFLIERSSDANNYKQIGSIAAAGNSSNPLDYTFTDALPSEGINYYRLKLLDKDGIFSYSKTVILSSTQTSIGIFPNPVTDVVNIYLNNTALLQSKVNMYDENGKLVQSILLTDNQQKINVQKLSKGMYTLTFVDGSAQHFIKE